MTEAAEIIRIQGLTKAFNREVLRGIDFTMQPGQTIGLIGRNGAGKTTLIKIILGFLKPTGGEIKVFDQLPGNTGGKVGYLPEKPDYHLLFSGTEYLGHLARMAGVVNPETRVKETLAVVGMTGRASNRMSRYSKGMLQRIGLAQAILTDPELLILDEPLSGLDPAGQKELRDIIRELGSVGKSIFLCSHLLEEVEKVCTGIAILHQGRILGQGSLREALVVKNRYKLLVNGLEGQALDRLKADYSLEVDPLGLLIYEEKEPGEKETLLKELLNAGAFIEELNPFKKSLEDYFITKTGE